MKDRHLQLLAEDPVEEANLAPLADLFFLILAAVLVHSTFHLIHVNPPTSEEEQERRAAAAGTEAATIEVHVLDIDSWAVNGEVVPTSEARSAIQAALSEAGENARVRLSVSNALSAETSWRARALLGVDWGIPFREIQPLDLAPRSE